MRLIDADDVRNLLKGVRQSKILSSKTDAIDFAIIALDEEIKNVDPENLRPQGEWKYFHKQNIAVCTNCGFERNLALHFGKAVSCPNCGARMKTSSVSCADSFPKGEAFGEGNIE